MKRRVLIDIDHIYVYVFSHMAGKLQTARFLTQRL
jgi:hypothetical protein